MLRSMYSGISGLKNFQTKLDVIGNNISNVNTYGFKKGRVVFKDLISQTTSGASGASETRGGVNPKQVGLGSQIAAIDTIHATGSLQTTSRTLDLAISGEGFFQVADSFLAPVAEIDNGTNGTIDSATLPAAFSNTVYTRAGNFYMDAEGYLVNSDGKYLVGFSGEFITDVNPTLGTYTPAYLESEDVPSFDINNGQIVARDESDFNNQYANFDDDTTDEPINLLYRPIKIPTDAQSISIGQDGTINFVDAQGVLRFAGKIVLAKFPNAEGLEKAGSNYYNQSPNSGVPLLGFGTESGIGSVQSGFLEMSNVDLSEEFTEMIVAQRGFQANSRIITTSDEILQELVNLKR